MRILNYNDSTNVLRLEFPNEWNASSVSGVTLTIKNMAGTTLLASSAATLYTATTISADADRYASEITLAAGAGALSPGDHIEIGGVAGVEHHVVRGYDSTSRVVTLEGILDNDHESGDAVRALFCSKTVDTSTVATFPAGTMMSLLWTANTGDAFTELAQIAKTKLDIEALEVRFRALYRRAYDDFLKDNTLTIIRDEAEKAVRAELLSSGLNMDRIVDQDKIAPVVMARMAYLWTFNGDESKTDEREFFGAEYNKLFGLLTRDPVWTDDDQDLVQDDDEVTDHPVYFERGW